MYPQAVNILRSLPKVLEETYGKSAAEALTDIPIDDTNSLSQDISVITLDTEDRYMNGNAQFIFTGLETVAKHGTANEDERSMHVRSNLSGFTGHQTFASQDNSISGISHPYTDNSRNQPDPAPDPYAWTQVGTEADRARLQQAVQSATTPPPGGLIGGRCP